MAGIFGTQGIWSCGLDFLPNGNLTAGGVFDIVSNSCNVNATFARISGKGVNCNNFSTFTRGLNTNLPSFYTGFGFLATNLPIGPCGLLQLNDTGVIQLGLGYNILGQFQFYQNNVLVNGSNPSTVIGPPSIAGSIVPGAYNFLELFVTIDPAVGVLQLKLNNNLLINFAGNTRKTANSFLNQVVFGANGGGAAHYFDDIYMLDTTAPAPLNTFLGNGRIQTDGPNAGSATGGLNTWAFTTPAGTDFGNAANIPANAAQFNSDATVGHRMSLRFPALAAQKALFLNTWLSAQQDSAGTRQITPKFRSNNVDQAGGPIVLSNGTYVYSSQSSAVDPNTGLPWASGLVADAGACEIGVETTT